MRVEWVVSSLALYLRTWWVYPALLPLLPLMRTSRLPVANLNGLIHFAERPNLFSARVPSRFKRAVTRTDMSVVSAVLSVTYSVTYKIIGRTKTFQQHPLGHFSFHGNAIMISLGN